MKRTQLEGTIYWKISCELKLFKFRMLQKNKEDILADSYKICTTIAIYECLVEQIETLTDDMLNSLLYCPNILEYIYTRWLKIEDSYNTELLACVKNVLFNFTIKENVLCQIR